MFNLVHYFRIYNSLLTTNVKKTDQVKTTVDCKQFENYTRKLSSLFTFSFIEFYIY
jgi:hypothetical protein